LLSAYTTNSPPSADLFEARAMLLGRLGRHDQALELYAYRLQDYQKAEECVWFVVYFLLLIKLQILQTCLPTKRKYQQCVFNAAPDIPSTYCKNTKRSATTCLRSHSPTQSAARCIRNLEPPSAPCHCSRCPGFPH
jgi:hypothetical protein